MLKRKQFPGEGIDRDGGGVAVRAATGERLLGCDAQIVVTCSQRLGVLSLCGAWGSISGSEAWYGAGTMGRRGLTWSEPISSLPLSDSMLHWMKMAKSRNFRVSSVVRPRRNLSCSPRSASLARKFAACAAVVPAGAVSGSFDLVLMCGADLIGDYHMS